eukprot:95167-Alexandrium_andersonii.AAC.1
MDSEALGQPAASLCFTKAYATLTRRGAVGVLALGCESTPASAGTRGGSGGAAPTDACRLRPPLLARRRRRPLQ